jgi:hypothetical protein
MSVKKLLEKIAYSVPKVKQIFWFLGVNAFAVVLILILIDIFWGEFLFYKYVLLAKKEPPKVDDTFFKFDNKDYQRILAEWQIRDQELQEFLEKNYTSPF